MKQARSRQLRDRTLACAHALVQEGRFAGTSMADIARTVGCSVGALYDRFHDKEALFASVVELTMAREVEALRAQAQSGHYRGLTLRDTVHRCVHDYAAFVTRNRAMIRALYQRSTEQPEYWGIVRVAAFEMVQVWVEAVAQAAGRTDRAFLSQVGVAFQFVSSSLAHTALVGTPTRPLTAAELQYWLDEMVMHFIGLQVPALMLGTPLVRPAPVRVPGRTPGPTVARRPRATPSPPRRKTDS